MMSPVKRTLFLISAMFCAAAAPAAVLPGFKIEKIADSPGFITSLAYAPGGTLYYSTRPGDIYRLDGTESVLVAHVDTANEGNEALLGIAIRGRDEIIAHYVLPDGTADAVGSIALADGKETLLATYPCDNGNVCPTEHHGGNVVIAPDGSIFFGIGDYAGMVPAQKPDSPGGKIHHIAPDGTKSVFAMGLRNPFDLAWDVMAEKLVLSDNGPVGEDEINVLSAGDNLGWPYTMGNQPPVDGMKGPVYVFPKTTAPTGIFIAAPNDQLRRGLMVTGFVTRSLEYFPDISLQPFASPIEIISDEVGPLLDVVQAPDGTLIIAGMNKIYRVLLPLRGDVDGNRIIDDEDAEALGREILDGDGTAKMDAHRGAFPGAWGADVNRDDLIDVRDLVALAKLRGGRSRPVGTP
jgi:glucose/arabinose dehydrogenase